MSTIEGLTLLGVVVALGVAVVGWRQANRAARRADQANTHAAEANRIADDALALAKAADARADRFEIQSLESRDVSWTRVDTDDEHRLTFRNIGADEAHDVQLTIDPIHHKWPRRSEAHGTVAGGARIAMNLTTEVRGEYERWQQDNRAPSDVVFISVPSVPVQARITWKSASGIPASQAFEDITL